MDSDKRWMAELDKKNSVKMFLNSGFYSHLVNEVKLNVGF